MLPIPGYAGILARPIHNIHLYEYIICTVCILFQFDLQGQFYLKVIGGMMISSWNGRGRVSALMTNDDEEREQVLNITIFLITLYVNAPL